MRGTSRTKCVRWSTEPAWKSGWFCNAAGQTGVVHVDQGGNENILTEEEFASKKAELLSGRNRSLRIVIGAGDQRISIEGLVKLSAGLRHMVERRQQWRGVLVAAGLRPNVGLLATTPSRPRSHDSRFANPSACKFFATGSSPHNCDVHGAIRDDRSVGWVRGQTSGRSALFHSCLQGGADPYLLDGTVRFSTSIARHPALRARLSHVFHRPFHPLAPS